MSHFILPFEMSIASCSGGVQYVPLNRREENGEIVLQLAKLANPAHPFSFEAAEQRRPAPWTGIEVVEVGLDR